MPTTYEKADAEDIKLLDEVMGHFHLELKGNSVRVGLIMVRAERDEKTGQPKRPAVTVHGVPAAAFIKKTSDKDRPLLAWDARIWIDADRWDDLKDQERVALLDHELTHLLLVKDKADRVVRSSDDRPKLTMRPDEWTLTGFSEVVLRHREHALEYQALRTLFDRHGQTLFPFMADSIKTKKKAV